MNLLKLFSCVFFSFLFASPPLRMRISARVVQCTNRKAHFLFLFLSSFFLRPSRDRERKGGSREENLMTDGGGQRLLQTLCGGVREKERKEKMNKENCIKIERNIREGDQKNLLISLSACIAGRTSKE
mmetsp:Transcript_15059/g.30510  ORF Transcript_15059/g.30510 Transcript_15059/m.30510 type:complete len:128 (-) Transcript_15059:483-866(-)